MRIDHIVLALAAALVCAACASSPKLETASVGATAGKRPAAEKSAATKASVAAKSDQAAKSDPSARVGFNDSGRASYCARWLEHRANGTLPSHVTAGSPDVAHGDAYCRGYQ